MNRIVRENYPVENLPEDLRSQFSGQSEVTLIIDGGSTQPVEARGDDEAALVEIRRIGVRGGDFSPFKRFRKSLFAADDDVGAYITSLRAD